MSLRWPGDTDQVAFASMGDIDFVLQAIPRNAGSWADLARRAENLGFLGIEVPDHPGSTPAPFVSLATAAAVTERITLGTSVANAGAWEPLALASAVATLDLLSDGRAVLGIGAGHTPAEWLMRGVPYPTAAERITRMIELTDATRRLLAGETVTLHGDHVTLDDAHLTVTPIQHPVPLLIGGNGPRLLRYAAEHADVIGVSGLGRTLEDGHRHETLWSRSEIDRRIELVHQTAQAAGRSPVIEVMVQQVELTDDAEAAARVLADQVGSLTVEDALDAPFVWMGTAEEIATQIRTYRERWGITRYAVREPAIDAVGQVRAILEA